MAKKVLNAVLLIVGVLFALAGAVLSVFPNGIGKSELKVIVPLVLALAGGAYIIYEICREDGELRPSNVFLRQPAKFFFDTTVFAAVALFVSVRDADDLLSFAFLHHPGYAIVFVLGCICAIAWIISEFCSPRFWCGLIRIPFKCALIALPIAFAQEVPLLYAVVVLYALFVGVCCLITLYSIFVEGIKMDKIRDPIMGAIEEGLFGSGDLESDSDPAPKVAVPHAARDKEGNVYSVKEHNGGLWLQSVLSGSFPLYSYTETMGYDYDGKEYWFI